MENLNIHPGDKIAKYETLLPQIKAVVEAERDPIANMANVSAMLKQTFCFWWVGFYRVIGDKLVLGPYNGPLACTRIAKGRGVCGTAWERAATVIVPDVEQFPGHIACSSLSRSEIVVPLILDSDVIGVLDVDSEKLDTFDETDARFMEEIVRVMIENSYSN